MAVAFAGSRAGKPSCSCGSGELQMASPRVLRACRRQFLRFLASSPLMAHAGTSFAQRARPADPLLWAPRDINELIENPRQALDVFDFEPVAHKNIPPAHFGYLTTGVDDEVTLRANREAFQKFELLPRRLIDVSKIDMRTNILG